MKEAKELYEKLKGINAKGVGLVSMATVTKVDRNTCTCIVEIDGMEVKNVRLKSITDEGKGFKIFPALNSDVLVQRISNGEYLVLMYSEINSVLWDAEKKMEFNTGGLRVEFDGLSDRLGVQNSAYTLRGLMMDFIEICAGEIHLTNAGPSVSISPVDKAKFEELKLKFNKLLK